MISLEAWQAEVSDWYQSGKHDQVEPLVPLILQPPEAIWGPLITDEQSKAIACWLDGCLRIFQHYKREESPTKSYEYLNFAYAKLQAVSCNPEAEIDLKHWCLKRLDHLIVVMLEQCNQLGWTEESQKQIQCHVEFMSQQQQNLNLAVGNGS
ncbi:transcriptional regulator [Vibrio penaeicida]|uniref:transcriptional regulator n=1 Tax=Vibrio penaeicida TaxID=104609 RepID=UPI002736B6BC|nr:transcriptional regulator [Vibrio penaeicida]MDP2572593.1 transcriptional regulator [Vibrio penaeicida]